MKTKLFALMFACLAIMAAVMPVVQAQQFDFKTRQAVASDFAAWKVYAVSTTAIASGARTITIEDPRVTVQGYGQINPIVANSPMTFDVGSVQETVTVTAVSCAQPTACTLTATFGNAHAGRMQITSGTLGAQEALDYLANTGGNGTMIIQPQFAGATSIITSLVRGSTSLGVEDWRTGGVVYYGWNGTANYIQTLGIPNTGVLVEQGMTKYVEATADTSTAGATYTPATGLTWTIPAKVAVNYPFHCVVTWTEATAATANAFGIQTATNAPTAGALNGLSTTGATAVVRSSVTGYNATTATTIVTATPGASAQTDQVILDGFIEQPLSATASIVTVGVATVSGGTDITTIKRGSYCRLF